MQNRKIGQLDNFWLESFGTLTEFHILVVIFCYMWWMLIFLLVLDLLWNIQITVLKYQEEKIWIFSHSRSTPIPNIFLERFSRSKLPNLSLDVLMDRKEWQFRTCMYVKRKHCRTCTYNKDKDISFYWAIRPELSQLIPRFKGRLSLIIYMA